MGNCIITWKISPQSCRRPCHQHLSMNDEQEGMTVAISEVRLARPSCSTFSLSPGQPDKSEEEVEEEDGSRPC